MPDSFSEKKLRFLFYVEQNYSFDILRPLQDLSLTYGFDVRWFLASDDVSSEYLNKNELKLNNITECVDFNPDAVFAPGDRVPSFIPGLKVQVFHGLNESKRGNIYPERGLFDLYCTEGPERTASLNEIALTKKYFQVVETGWIKLDSLFQFKSTYQYERPQILFASTFSPSLSCAEMVFDTIKVLSKSSQWQWIITLHPKMDDKIVKKYRSLENENLIFYENNQVIEALHRADVMIGDNSSIFQEFLLLNKPVVTVNNRDPLDCFININKPDELYSAIESALNPSSELIEKVKNYGRTVTPFLDGESSKRVLSAVQMALDKGWTDKKPINLFRNIKMRKKLKYWKI